MTMTLSEAKKRRLPRSQRAKPEDLPAFGITSRDYLIVKAVCQYRALTTDQVERLFFSSSSQPSLTKGKSKINPRCQRRLQLLFHHGFLYRSKQPQRFVEENKPLVYFLDTQGIELLAEDEGLIPADLTLDMRNIESATLQHLILSNEVRIAVEQAARLKGWIIEKWLDERTLKSPQMKDTITLTGPEGGKRSAAVVPDGYFKLSTGSGEPWHHFIEIDRGTVTGRAAQWGRRDWSHKIQAYIEYVASGKYQTRYQAKGMRVLTITTGEKRLAHLKEITEGVGGKSRFWFSTFERLAQGNILNDVLWSVATKPERFPLMVET
jgi:hypothetical protein